MLKLLHNSWIFLMQLILFIKIYFQVNFIIINEITNYNFYEIIYQKVVIWSIVILDKI